MGTINLAGELKAAAARQPDIRPNPTIQVSGTTVSFGVPSTSVFADTVESTRVRVLATGDASPLQETRVGVHGNLGDLKAEVAFRRREIGLDGPPQKPVIYHFDPKFRSVSTRLTVQGRGSSPDVSVYRNDQQSGTRFQSVIADVKRGPGEQPMQVELGESVPRKGPTIDSVKVTAHVARDLQVSGVVNVGPDHEMEGLGITLIGRF